MAAALFRLERSRDLQDLKPVLEALLKWLKQPEHRELQRSFASWLRNVLLPLRMPGVEIPEMVDLEEVKTMLADRVVEWTREWKREGFEEGLLEARKVLVQHIEERFGPLSEELLDRLEAVDSVKTLMEMMSRVPLARSLDDLGLA